ncbi:MAG TPA: flagellar hook-length control protein FliK [Clostridia bacterium]
MRIDGLLNGQANVSANAFSILSKLNVGDMVRAKVLEITSGEVLLKLFDGSTVSAADTSGLNAKKGDMIDLLIKAKTDSQVFLEPKIESTGKEENIGKLLAGMNIKPDAGAFEVAKEIKNQGFPLKKDIIEKAAGTLTALKDVSVKSAVFMAANGIEPSSEKMQLLKNMVSGKDRLGSEIKSLVDDIKKLDTDVLNKLSEVLSKADSGENTQLAKNVSKPQIPSKNEIPSNTNQVINNEEIKENNQSNKLSVEKDSQKTSPGLPLKEEESSVKAVQSSVQKDIELKDTDMSGKKLTGILSKDEVPLKGKELKVMLQKLANFEDGPYGKLESNSTNIDEPHANVLKKVVKSIERAFIKVDHEITDSDLSLKKTYSELSSKLEMIKDTLKQQNTPESSNIIKRAETMESGLKLINEINSFNSYYQIPLSFGDNNTTGELYILKKERGRKKIDPENASMLISLDTENIGRVDSFIGINKKSVSVSMRVESEGLFDFIKQNRDELYKRLQNSGFKLVDLRCKLIDEQVNLINASQAVKKEFGGCGFDLKI